MGTPSARSGGGRSTLSAPTGPGDAWQVREEDRRSEARILGADLLGVGEELRGALGGRAGVVAVVLTVDAVVHAVGVARVGNDGERRRVEDEIDVQQSEEGHEVAATGCRERTLQQHPIVLVVDL